MSSSIAFHLSFTEPQAHYVDVRMTIHGFEDHDYLDVKMPVWAPGSYLIREYAKNIERFQAHNHKGEPVRFEKTNKNTWRIFADGQDVTIHYSVYAFERSVRTSFIDAQHAFLSPVGTFFYVDNHLEH